MCLDPEAHESGMSNLYILPRWRNAICVLTLVHPFILVDMMICGATPGYISIALGAEGTRM